MEVSLMNIDNNEKEKRAFALTYEGKKEEGQALQEEFLDDLHKALRNKEQDFCSCKVDCNLHGKCLDCIAVHRGHQDHLPNCLHDIVNKKLEVVLSVTESKLDTGIK